MIFNGEKVSKFRVMEFFLNINIDDSLQTDNVPALSSIVDKTRPQNRLAADAAARLRAVVAAFAGVIALGIFREKMIIRCFLMQAKS